MVVMQQEPKVSVIVPNYNHATYLAERLGSVLGQTYTNVEVIILDDCSTDNSREIIERYRANEKVAHIVYNSTNSGSTFRQWQKGIAYATGEFIWIAESDDYCELNFLEILVNGMINQPSCSIAFAQSVCVDKDKNILWETPYNLNSQYLHGREFIQKYMLYNNTIVNASMAIFKKDSYLTLSHDFTQFRYCGDWLFWIELARAGDVYISRERLNYFRKHDADVTGYFLASGSIYIEQVKLLQMLLQKHIVSGKVFQILLYDCFAAFHKKRRQFDGVQAGKIQLAFLEIFKSRQSFRKFLLVQRFRKLLLPVKKVFIYAPR